MEYIGFMSSCFTTVSISELTQQNRAQHLSWTSPPVSSFPHQSPVGKEEAVPLSLHSPLSVRHRRRSSRCRYHHHRLALGLQAPGSQPGRSIIKDACASEILTSLFQSACSATLMSKLARCRPPLAPTITTTTIVVLELHFFMYAYTCSFVFNLLQHPCVSFICCVLFLYGAQKYSIQNKTFVINFKKSSSRPFACPVFIKTAIHRT